MLHSDTFFEKTGNIDSTIILRELHTKKVIFIQKKKQIKL